MCRDPRDGLLVRGSPCFNIKRVSYKDSLLPEIKQQQKNPISLGVTQKTFKRKPQAGLPFCLWRLSGYSSLKDIRTISSELKKQTLMNKHSEVCSKPSLDLWVVKSFQMNKTGFAG